MPIEEAVRVFQKYGVDIAEMPLEKIHKYRNTLLRKYHPDAGGKIEIAQEINAAFGFLRSCGQGLWKPEPPANQANAWQIHPDKWAWARHSGLIAPNTHISRHDFTDPNFIKKSMWELSGFSDEAWVIHGYDGLLFTNSVVVYASSKIFYYMAIAMIDLQTKGGIPLSCRAVLVHPVIAPNLYLIYADGKHYDEDPQKFVLEAGEINHVNCSEFMQKLPEILDHLGEKAAAQSELALAG